MQAGGGRNCVQETTSAPQVLGSHDLIFYLAIFRKQEILRCSSSGKLQKAEDLTSRLLDGVLKLRLPTKLPPPELGWLGGGGGRGSVPASTGLSTRPLPSAEYTGPAEVREAGHLCRKKGSDGSGGGDCLHSPNSPQSHTTFPVPTPPHSATAGW